MKFKNRIELGLLLSVISLGSVGCGSDKKEDNSESFNKPQTGAIVEEAFEHQVEGTTHIFNTKQNATLFAKVNEICYYDIYVNESDAYAKNAAQHIKKHLAMALNIDINDIQSDEGKFFDETEKIIYVGSKDVFENAGLKQTVDVGNTGYTLKSKGNSIFLLAVESDAYALGANKLLEHLVGYDHYMNNFVTYEKAEKETELFSYDFDDAEIPDYQFRVSAGYSNSEYQYSAGITANPIIHKKEYPWIHNAYSLLEEYHDEYPEWFDDSPGYRPDNPSKQVFQLCYLAHGDSDSLQLMVEKGAEKIIKILTESPGKKIISITAEDTASYCKCPSCLASIAKYKTEAGSIVQYINRVAAIVTSYFKDDGTYKGPTARVSKETFPVDYDYTIFFFAYHNTVTSPTYMDDQGNFHPIDESVICAEHVGVMMAPSNAKYIYSFYDKRNEAVANQCKGWASCTKRFLAYLYSDNWRGYTYPYNSFSADVENMKFFKELNAIWMFDSCGGENPLLPGFQEFKKYLINKAMVNVNCDVDALTKKFFRNVYGDAADKMFELYHSERAYCLEIADVYVGNINDNTMFEGETGAKRWPAGCLLDWTKMCEDAMNELSVIKLTNPEKYELIKTAILLESIFPRFAMLDLHGEYYDESTFKLLAKKLKDDMLSLQFTYVKEHDNGLLTLWFDKWGV